MSSAKMVLVHRVGELIVDALERRFPPVDGSWHRCPPWQPGLGAVVALTGYAVFVLPDDHPVGEAELAALDPHGFGGAAEPRVVMELARGGWVDTLDLILARRGLGGPATLVPRPDLAGTQRSQRAEDLRSEVRVLGHSVGTEHVVLGRGIGGLVELSIEVPEREAGTGAGRSLIMEALHELSPEEVMVAAVAPGNTRSLRACLACGFEPVGSVQLFRRMLAS